MRKLVDAYRGATATEDEYSRIADRRDPRSLEISDADLKSFRDAVPVYVEYRKRLEDEYKALAADQKWAEHPVPTPPNPRVPELPELPKAMIGNQLLDAAGNIFLENALFDAEPVNLGEFPLSAGLARIEDAERNEGIHRYSVLLPPFTLSVTLTYTSTIGDGAIVKTWSFADDPPKHEVRLDGLAVIHHCLEYLQRFIAPDAKSGAGEFDLTATDAFGRTLTRRYENADFNFDTGHGGLDSGAWHIKLITDVNQ